MFRLAGEGLVEVSSRRGTFARQVTIQDVLETIEARVVLESGCIDLVVPDISDEMIAELERLYRATLEENACRDYRHF